MWTVKIKKISFDTYIKFCALIGISIGCIFIFGGIIIALAALATINEDPFSKVMLLLSPVFMIMGPLIWALVFTTYGIITYPVFLLIQKILKKITLRMEVIEVIPPYVPPAYGYYPQQPINPQYNRPFCNPQNQYNQYSANNHQNFYNNNPFVNEQGNNSQNDNT